MAVLDMICIASIIMLVLINIYLFHKFGILSKEFKEETKREEMMLANIEKIKLASNDYDVDELIGILRKEGFKSNFKLSMKKE
jgi:hypothetical protein